jgi:hypothetical protein
MIHGVDNLFAANTTIDFVRILLHYFQQSILIDAATALALSFMLDERCAEHKAIPPEPVPSDVA